MTISPQSQSIYQILLSSNQAFSAKELASKLHIFPATVYRLTQPLIDIGLIIQSDNYPSFFRAKPIGEGLSLFLLNQTNWFSKQFKSNRSNTNQDMEFSFVQSRDELMKSSADEINRAEKSVDLLRSGHEMSADVMLAIVNANKRNVTTRMLIQDYDESNKDQVSCWKQNGILVRKTPLVHIRLMIYDARIAYFMSYKHEDSQKDLGMKISYPPFAAILSNLFQEWWKKAEKI